METGADCAQPEDFEHLLDPTTDHHDAWGNAFEVHCDGTVVHVASRGPDGQVSEDDIRL